MTHSQRSAAGSLVATLTLALLAGCQGSSDSEGTVTVQGDVPLVYAKRVNTLGLGPTNGTPSAAGGDLMLREKSSPSAPEHNLTAAITQGKGDASDPEVSYDAKKVIFSLRCPSSNSSTIDGQPACTGRWNLWEYDMTVGGLTQGTLRRLTASNQHDDVDPAYLPAGRGVVFASNRQAKSSLNQALGRAYFALDEYERERVLNLHTMAADGSGITQITFNQSHDRNPVVRANGDIFFTEPPYGLSGPNEKLAREIDFHGVYRVKPTGETTLLTKELDRPNGLALSPDEKILYVAQSHGPHPVIMAYPIKTDGTLEKGSIFYNAKGLSGKGMPDGMKVRSDGTVFCTGPGGLLILNPEGKLLGRILCGRPTANVAFGTDESVIYLTSDDRILRVALSPSSK